MNRFCTKSVWRRSGPPLTIVTPAAKLDDYSVEMKTKSRKKKVDEKIWNVCGDLSHRLPITTLHRLMSTHCFYSLHLYTIIELRPILDIGEPSSSRRVVNRLWLLR